MSIYPLRSNPIMGNAAEWGLLDGAVQKLEGAWSTKADPGFANLVPPASDPLRQRILVELIKVDREFSWRWGPAGLWRRTSASGRN